MKPKLQVGLSYSYHGRYTCKLTAISDFAATVEFEDVHCLAVSTPFEVPRQERMTDILVLLKPKISLYLTWGFCIPVLRIF